MCTNLLFHGPVTPGTPGPQLQVSGRVMELPGFPTAALYRVPRGQAFPWVKPPLAAYHRWQNRYGFVAISKPKPVFDLFPVVADGLNEAGLSCACLWHAGVDYPTTDSPTESNLYYTEVVAWALGNFESVEAMEAVLSSGEVQIVGPAPGTFTPLDLSLHFIAIDRTGASLVVEFVGGAMQLYGPAWHRQNQEGLAQYANGALTNAPGYDWQCTNLQIYSNLTPIGSETSAHKSYPLVGSGLVGLPGDSTAPSRFVRAVMMQYSVGLLAATGENWLPAPWHVTALGQQSAYAGPVQALVNMALQAVQVVMATPYGTLLVPGTEEGPPQIGDWSAWTAVRDHTNAVLYCVSGFNNIPQAIDLAALDFDTPTPEDAFPNYPSLALVPPPPDLAWYQDATQSFAGG